ncbi:unnamed protein product [Timema podura]|uniref:Peptidase M14 domain-containing protein n=1 Tax=Timema podura TaxID=61482 RepID=A0ABN7NFH5_TIMPD|nr:unnamed protein product [Timema podura]
MKLRLWSDVQDVHNPVHIMVPPYQEEEFTNLIKSFSMPHTINMHNVQDIKHLGHNKERGATGDDVGVVTLSDVGETYEGRVIKAVKISHKTGNRGVFIETGIHACEWIGPATVLYILNELLTSNNTEIRDIADNFDWYIVPSANPDGYEYSHTTDRLWRKTRSEYNATCYGVDPNRNWDFHWGEVGTSPDPCSRMYAGPEPLSEVEIRGLSQYITSVAERLDVYISLHSYGQLLMFPYGFTDDPVDNYDVLYNIAEKAANSLTSVHGTVYKFGPIISTVYPASGSSLDWVKGVLNVTFTFAYELRDNGTYGDLLPANLIIPSGEETLASVITILQQARVPYCVLRSVQVVRLSNNYTNG